VVATWLYWEHAAGIGGSKLVKEWPAMSFPETAVRGRGSAATEVVALYFDPI
jgi:hypothetical protein